MRWEFVPFTDTVSSPLDHNANKQTDDQAVAVARGRDEEFPSGAGSERGLALNSFADLAVFVDHKRIVLVAVGVEAGQNFESFFFAAVGDEEARRLRNDE